LEHYICSYKDFFINFLPEIRNIETSSFISESHTNSGSDLYQGPRIYVWFFVYLAETYRQCFKTWKTTSGTGISLPLIIWMSWHFFTLQILDAPYVGVWLCFVLRFSYVSFKPFQSRIKNMCDLSFPSSTDRRNASILGFTFCLLDGEGRGNLQTFVQHLRNHQLDYLTDYTPSTRLAISVLLTYVTFKLWIVSAVVGRPQLCLCGTQFRLIFYCRVIVWGGEQSWKTFRGL